MGNYTSYILMAAAGLFLAGPQVVEMIKFLVPTNLLKRPSLPATSITFTKSLTSLAEVRQRLVDTGGVPKDAEAAIEVLTHALLAGSDK